MIIIVIYYALKYYKIIYLGCHTVNRYTDENISAKYTVNISREYNNTLIQPIVNFVQLIIRSAPTTVT